MYFSQNYHIFNRPRPPSPTTTLTAFTEIENDLTLAAGFQNHARVENLKFHWELSFPYLSLTYFCIDSFSFKNLSWYIWPLISPRFMKQALWKLFGFLQNMVMQLHAFMLMELCHCGRRLLKVLTASSMLELGSVVHGSFVFYACLLHILWINTFAGYTNFMQQVIYFDFRPWLFWHIVPCSTTLSSAFHLICLFFALFTFLLHKYCFWCWYGHLLLFCDLWTNRHCCIELFSF